MHLVVYISKLNKLMQNAEEVVSDIVQNAKKKNQALGITGVLLYENGHFLQALEGDEKVVNELYNIINKDTRHSDVSKLIDETIDSRAFPDWSLDTFFIDSPDLVNKETISHLHKVYANSFDLDSKKLIEFIKKMVDELDTFKILTTHDSETKI